MALSVRALLVVGCSSSSGPWTKWEAACGIKGTRWDQQQPYNIKPSSRELSSPVCSHVSVGGRCDVLQCNAVQPLLEGPHAGSELPVVARHMALQWAVNSAQPLSSTAKWDLRSTPCPVAWGYCPEEDPGPQREPDSNSHSFQ